MFLNDDDMVECPYNSTHRMLRKRLQSHLLKCRRYYKDVELRKCPFNITHLIPEPEYAHHATNCPDRKLITQYKYDAPEPKEEEIQKHAPIECDENWDDTEVVDYNPKLHLKNAKVLLRPTGSNRSERKLFKKEERKRLGDDSSDDDIKSEEASPRNKRQKDGHYRDDFETRTEKNEFLAYDQGHRSGYKRDVSPCSSSSYRQRSRSPKTEFDSRNPSVSPTASRRSFREYSPPSRGSYSYFDTADERYLKKGRMIPNNDQYNSGRDEYASLHTNRYYEASYTMPDAPPPPIISYSTSPSSSSRYPYPPFSNR